MASILQFPPRPVRVSVTRAILQLPVRGTQHVFDNLFADRGETGGWVRVSLNSEGGMMALVGLLVTFAGFLLAVASVGLTSSTSVRLVMVLVGIAVSLGGIMGLITPAYRQNAAWKR